MNENKQFALFLCGSAGSFAPIIQAVEEMDKSHDLPIFLLIHTTDVQESNIHSILNKKLSRYEVYRVEEEMEILPRTIYVARAGYHLMVEGKRVFSTRGPMVNNFRPSIDVLLRSAACAFQEGSIGMIFSGYLHDGVDGLKTLVDHGGLGLIQDPESANVPDLIKNVLKKSPQIKAIQISELSSLIDEFTSSKEVEKENCDRELVEELRIDKGIQSFREQMLDRGEHLGISCPDCGGPLWKLSDDRIRCHVGHSYNANSWLLSQSDALERVLWSSLRMFEERLRMLNGIQEKTTAKTVYTVDGKLAGIPGKIAEVEETIGLIRKIIRKPFEVSPESDEKIPLSSSSSVGRLSSENQH